MSEYPIDTLIEYGLTTDQLTALKSRNILTMPQVCDAVRADRIKDIFPSHEEQAHVLCVIADHMKDLLAAKQAAAKNSKRNLTLFD